MVCQTLAFDENSGCCEIKAGNHTGCELRQKVLEEKGEKYRLIPAFAYSFANGEVVPVVFALEWGMQQPCSVYLSLGYPL